MSTAIAIETILEALSEPFPQSDVEWKPGAVNKERTKALALAYVDSRAYIQRLNLVAPDWEDRYVVTTQEDRVFVVCSLTIAGVTRTGDGEAPLYAKDRDGESYLEPNALTTASAQAFKRACVKFSLGAYLYNLPQTWCDYDERSRRIVNPPKLPDWALCPAEAAQVGKARSENDAALAAARTARQANDAALATARSVEQAEAERLAQAATERVAAEHPELAAAEAPAQTRVHFGKNQGKTLGELMLSDEGQSWVEWLVTKFTPRDSQGTDLQRKAKLMLMRQPA